MAGGQRGATVAVIAAGAMGSAVARRLVENGATVPTLLDGRGDATRSRAADAGMHAADLAEVARADVILSIVPPGEAMALAARLAPALKAAATPAVYVDCNALDVRTVQAVADVVAATGAAFVDGGIIGGPPKPGAPGPTFYLSGDPAARIAPLLAGLQVTVMDGAVGAASALKMSYAGITKGLTALASFMVLGAERAGAGPALRAELAASQPALLARFGTALPEMVPKAYRWVAEMREIAAFLDDPDGGAVFEAFARLYDQIATDAVGEREMVTIIERFARPA